MEVPHRYDLIQDSCVNKKVEKFNSRIRKHIKVHLDRRGFPKYGLHMNTTKERIDDKN
jgi:hypothetical protein